VRRPDRLECPQPRDGSLPAKPAHDATSSIEDLVIHLIEVKHEHAPRCTAKLETSEAGSAGRLQNILNVNSLAQFPLEMTETIGSLNHGVLTLIGEEWGHRFLAFTYYRLNRSRYNTLLGRSCSHWSYFQNTAFQSVRNGAAARIEVTGAQGVRFGEASHQPDPALVERCPECPPPARVGWHPRSSHRSPFRFPRRRLKRPL
jgi:hypothetical protein